MIAIHEKISTIKYAGVREQTPTNPPGHETWSFKAQSKFEDEA
jgi:hypothetical protein